MKLKYDGSLNTLLIFGKNNTSEFGSHFSVERDDGEVGIGIDSPSAKFHIKQDGSNGNDGIKLSESGTGGQDWYQYMNSNDDLIFDDDGSDVLVLQNGTHFVGVGTSSPDVKFHVKESKGGEDHSLSSHIALIENTYSSSPGSTSSNGSAANGLAIKLGRTSPNRHSNYITFFNSSSTARGRIEGQTSSDLNYDKEYVANLGMHNANVAFGVAAIIEAAIPCAGVGVVTCPGIIAMAIAQEVLLIGNRTTYQNFVNDNLGVSFSSGSADYAEYLKRADINQKIYPAQIVGSFGGEISLNTENSTQLFVVSTNPGVLGNMPSENDIDMYEKVAFLGQVPTMVRGIVKVGDFVIPSGKNDGVGIGVSPEKILPSQYSKIVGVAWSNSTSLGEVNYINMSIGLNNNDLANLAYNQELRIRKIEERLNILEGNETINKKTSLRTNDDITKTHQNEEEKTEYFIYSDEMPYEITLDALDEAIELILKSYRLSNIDIKSNPGLFQITSDVNYKLDVLEELNEIYKNGKVLFFQRNSIEVK